MQKTFVALAVMALGACEGDRQGVGFGPESYASSPGGSPQSTSATFEMQGLEPLPRYTFRTNGQNTPADALVAGASNLREADSNVTVSVESRTYLMRQIELDGNVYAVAEGAAPVASLPTVIRARTGCLVASNPLRSGDASVYSLNCS